MARALRFLRGGFVVAELPFSSAALSVIAALGRFVLAAILIAGSIATPARADDYPSRPIRLVVPFPPGGNNDVMGRLIAAAISPALGQPIVVDNRVGATGLVGSELV